MAQKSSSETKTTVRRIKATDTAPQRPRAPKSNTSTSVPVAKNAKKTAKASAANRKEMGYFKGAWHELKQVRWPTRSATWSLTAAVLVFTVIFVILILLLDAGFNWSFNQILK